ncbi:hypothetical protein AC579_3277 [Pseudocercospora musae]|uniref:Uncharacterized protein n=1 Tax=Pseudocercospora musae TaxID=113226 RepID=A0A139ID61_9PEZI|nr:hypothetical protein AC579_3277 [Pseudocercospora musae]
MYIGPIKTLDLSAGWLNGRVLDYDYSRYQEVAGSVLLLRRSTNVLVSVLNVSRYSSSANELQDKRDE